MFLKFQTSGGIGIESALCGSRFDLRCVQQIAIDKLFVFV